MKLSIWTLVGALVGAVSFAPATAAQSSRGLPDFTELYEQQGATVVSVDVTQTVRRSQLPDLSEDDPFYEFFRRFGQIPRGRERPRDREQQSVGSGFILSSDGYILTNAHVVDDAGEVMVKLSDKREFRAKVIGVDKRTDVAVLKIDATGLPKVTIGDPEKLRSASGSRRSASRSGWKTRSPPASSAPRAATCRARSWCRTFKPTCRSIRATPVDRCSI